MKYPILSILILISGLSTFYSCSRRPGNVLPQDKMTEVLYDIQLVNAMANDYPLNQDPKTKERMLNGVLEKHKITPAILDSSLMWYSDNMNTYTEVNDSIRARLNRELKVLRDEDLMMRGIDQNVIPFISHLDQKKNTLSFSLQSATLEEIIDKESFRFEFDVQGLNKGQRLEAGVYYTYKDTLVHDSLRIDENAHYYIGKPSLPDSLLTKINGYIHLKKSIINTPVFIYNIKYQDTVSVKTEELLPMDIKQ